MRELKGQKLLGWILCRLIDASAVEANFSFHAVCYSRKLFLVFGEHCLMILINCPLLRPSMLLLSSVLLVRVVRAVPDPPTVILSQQKCSNMEQVLILTRVKA